MIYGLGRMIYLQRKYDIISVPPICRRHISSLAEQYHIEDISPVPAGTDIIEKDRFLSKPVFFLVGEAGLEPARPEWTLEPESSESANSTTRAHIKGR